MSGASGRDVPDEIDPNESLARRYNRIVMAVVVEMQNVGNTANRAEIAAVVEHVLCDRPGDWRRFDRGFSRKRRLGNED